MAGSSKKTKRIREKTDVPKPTARESRLRRITPALPSPSIKLADASQLLSPTAQRKREEALSTLARRRQDAEARAGAIQLS